MTQATADGSRLASTGSVVDFGRLLQESRQLNARIRAGGHDSVFMPQLQRGLEQIEELSSQLGAKVARYGSATTAGGLVGASTSQGRAALFLASRGFDVSLLEADLERINRTVSLVPTSGAANAPMITSLEIDLDSFLQAELDLTIGLTLDRLEGETKEHTWTRLRQQQDESWSKARRTLSEQLSLPTTDSSRYAKDPSASYSGRQASLKAATYAKVIKAFNEARLRGKSFNLTRSMETELRSTEGTDPKTEMLLDCWRIHNFILDGDAEGENVFEAGGTLHAAYMADLNSSASRPWKAQLARGGKRFLEDLYVRYVERTLAQYPRDALLGGRPSRLERIKAFCDIKLKRMPPSELSAVELVNGTPVWMIIFHLLRCGMSEEALSYAQTHELAIQRSEPTFLSYLKNYVNSTISGGGGVLPASMQSQVRLEYNKLLATTAANEASPSSPGGKIVDPYKMTAFKIIGRCDLARKSVSQVVQTSEDYIWLQYCLLEDVTEEGEIGTAYTLTDLQRLVLDYGPRHFDPKNTNPWHYFEILSLVGLFEKGVEYLHQTGHFTDAVHFAVAMVNAETLRLGKPTDPLFVRHGPTQVVINFGALLTSYSRQQEDVLDAINTILLLTLPPKSPYTQSALDSIRDLVISSGDVASLLGDVSPEGSVRLGLLAQYSRLLDLPPGSTFLSTITAAAADKCDAEGRFRESLQLYNLANRYGRVLEVLNVRLSRAFIGPYLALEIEELRRMAEAILAYYEGQVHIASSLNPAARSTCSLLVTCLQLRRLYEEAQWPRALDTLTSLSTLVPLQGDISVLSAAADRVRELPDSLTLLLPELLLMAMTIIVRRAEQLAGFIGVDAGRAQQTDLLRRMARNLMTYVGMLRLRVPQEVYAQLTRMEISLG